MNHKTSYFKSLNKLLANYQVHYQNLRELHWNVKGQHFFNLIRNTKNFTRGYNVSLMKSQNAYLPLDQCTFLFSFFALIRSILKENELIRVATLVREKEKNNWMIRT